MKGLIYREFLLMKKTALGGAFMFFCYSLLCVLVMLSFKRGNLANLPPEIKEGVMPVVTLMVKFLAAALLSGLLTAINQLIQKDERVSWQRFRRSTPVSHWKYAAVRVIVTAALLMLAAALMLVYLLILGSVNDTVITIHDIAMECVILLAFLLFTVLTGVLTMALHSMEKAFVVVFAAIMAIIAALVLLTDNGSGTDQNNLVIIQNFCDAVFPFMPLILAAILGFEYVGTARLMNRKEQ